VLNGGICCNRRRAQQGVGAQRDVTKPGEKGKKRKKEGLLRSGQTYGTKKDTHRKRHRFRAEGTGRNGGRGIPQTLLKGLKPKDLSGRGLGRSTSNHRSLLFQDLKKTGDRGKSWERASGEGNLEGLHNRNYKLLCPPAKIGIGP